MRRAFTWQCARERGGGGTTVERMQDGTVPAAPDARLRTATSADLAASYQEDRFCLVRFLPPHGAEYAEARPEQILQSGWERRARTGVRLCRRQS